MEFSFCPDCGARLERRDLGDEKGVAWCERCGRPWFAMFPVAVIALVYNDSGEVLLLRQNYISTEFHNLVSGYVKLGEDAESCVVREIKEETGLEVDRVRLIFTDWFAKKEMMMIGFFAHAACCKLELSSEVDSAEWVEASLIKELLSPWPGSTSRRLALRFLNEREA